MNIEQLLYIVADSQQMDGWTDALSQIVKVTENRMLLEEDALAKVAGGRINNPHETERKL